MPPGSPSSRMLRRSTGPRSGAGKWKRVRPWLLQLLPGKNLEAFGDAGAVMTFTMNLGVVLGDFDMQSWLTRLVRFKIFGKSPISAFLRPNQLLWNKLPETFTAVSPIRLYGNFLHTLAKIQGVRAQAFSTYFLRNRPELELIQRLVERSTVDTLRV